MKMICPHCGVKGSANDSLIGTKVKCPKCLGIFVVESEVVQPIAVESNELEQLQDTPGNDLNMATNEEVDSVINELLGDTEEAANEMIDSDEEIDKLLLGDTDEADQEEMIAALADLEDDTFSEASTMEDIDETLTVIEDIPEEVLQDDSIESFTDEDIQTVIDADNEGQQVEEKIEEELHLEEEEITSQPEDLDTISEPEEDKEESPSDDIEIDDAFGIEEESPKDDIEINDAFDIDEETGEPADEPTEAKENADELKTLTSESTAEVEAVEEEYIELDEEAAAEEIDLDDEKVFAADAEGDDIEIELDTADAAEEKEEVVIDESHIIQKCSACSEYVDPEAKYEYENNVYCSKCLPPGAVRPNENKPLPDVESSPEFEESEVIDKDKVSEQEQDITEVVGQEEETLSDPDQEAVVETPPEKDEGEMLAAAAALRSEAEDAAVAAETPGKFTISTLIKDAFHYSKGAKGSIWAAIIVMSLILGGLWGGGAYLLYTYYSQGNSLAAGVTEIAIQMVFNFFSYLFTAGIIIIAIRRVGQETFSWRMLFLGFKRFGSVLLLYILMSIMLFIGFLLLILPGIYLTVGYMLALPLLFEKGLSPWQALERSRIAIHKRWWTVFFAMIAMSILTALSAIPFGIGLIWTIPMFSILIAVLYYHFFGAED